MLPVWGVKSLVQIHTESAMFASLLHVDWTHVALLFVVKLAKCITDHLQRLFTWLDLNCVQVAFTLWFSACFHFPITSHHIHVWHRSFSKVSFNFSYFPNIITALVYNTTKSLKPCSQLCEALWTRVFLFFFAKCYTQHANTSGLRLCLCVWRSINQPSEKLWPTVSDWFGRQSKWLLDLIDWRRHVTKG